MFKFKLSTIVALALAWSSALAVEEDPFCPCNSFSIESQLARIIGMAYDPKGPKADFAQANEIFECYAWKDLQYDLTKSGIIHRILKKLHWSTPRALVGRCGRRSDSCVVSFSGAANFDMVAGILDYGPTNLTITPSGSITEADDSSPEAMTYSFHASYWEVYKTMRSQVGDTMLETLSGCKDIVVTGHSIGSSMADLWHWEHQHLPVREITIGQNPAWFGTPPNLGCRGKRVVSEEDPIPYLRPFVDKQGRLIRHGLLPMQLLRKLTEEEKSTPATWVAEDLSPCDENEPMDPNCLESGCRPYGVHYNWVVMNRIDEHQASAYMKASDSAFDMTLPHQGMANVI